MKHLLTRARFIASLLTVAILGGPATGARLAAAEEPNRPFPYLIPVRTWMADRGFLRGDKIVITAVRGDRPAIEPGGTYVVEGGYVLQSVEEATLALSLTSSANGGRSRWTQDQRAKIQRGSRGFSLVATMHAAGEFHVSFYIPNPAKPGSSQAEGGIYFANR